MSARIILLLLICCSLAADGVVAEDTKPSLDEALAQLKVPPDWFNQVEVKYDTNHPWAEGRIEVRRLLSLNKNREAMKLTVLYLQKQDIGNGHEYPMYLYLRGK